jgi:hypothetical protein
MNDARTLNACGSGWDAGDAVATTMRIEAILDVATGEPSDPDPSIRGSAIGLLGTPADMPMACRTSSNGASVATVATSSNGGHGSLAFCLLDHPSMSAMVLDLPLGPSSLDDARLIWSTSAIVERLGMLLDAVRRSADLMKDGRRIDVVKHGGDARRVAKCAEAVVADCWTNRGSLSGALANVITTIQCPTPWTQASMTTDQVIGGAPQAPIGVFPDRSHRTPNPLLDDEGTAILGSLLPWSVTIWWDPIAKTQDGIPVRRMTVRPTQISTMISKTSLLDPMQTLRAHRTAPIPDHCIRRIGS